MRHALLLLLSACAPGQGWEAVRQELTATRVELAQAHHQISALRHDAQHARNTLDKLAQAAISPEPDFPDEADVAPYEIEPGWHYLLDARTLRALFDEERIVQRGYPIAVGPVGDRVGLRLAHVHSNSLLFRLGLRTGDIIRALNGYALSSFSEVITALTHVDESPQLRIAVQRRGALRSLIWELEHGLSWRAPHP